MLKQILLFVSVISLCILLFSCHQSPAYKSEVEIPGGIWNSKEAAVFNPNFDDTLQGYNIILSITNTKLYRYSNIWLFVKSKSPDGHYKQDTLEVSLADETGKWLGKKHGKLWNYKFYYKRNVRFPRIGKYTFEIQQGMRDLQLKGIDKLSFELDKSKN